MNVAGIDVSTRAVDIVKLDFDTRCTTWHHYRLHGDTALERASSAPDNLPIGSYWDDCLLVAIERPYGPGGDTLFSLHLVVGAVLAKLPPRLRPAWLLGPAEWRKACGMMGNAPKFEVQAFAVRELGTDAMCGWTQDTCDAFAIAYAARAINQKGVAA